MILALACGAVFNSTEKPNLSFTHTKGEFIFLLHRISLEAVLTLEAVTLQLHHNQGLKVKNTFSSSVTLIPSHLRTATTFSGEVAE